MSDAHEKILSLFLTHNCLLFSRIRDLCGIQSNLLSYRLKSLQKKGYLEKTPKGYKLTVLGERQLPVLSRTEVYYPLVIVLLQIKRQNKWLFVRRTKRPYKGYLSLVGGKLLFGERIEECALRLLKEKTGGTGVVTKICSVAHERILSGTQVKHDFLLVMVNVAMVNTPVDVIWSTRKGRIIPSDKWLITHKVPFAEFTINEKTGTLYME